ncbi:MAG TPA: CpaF family protein [Candidatus Binatia bacterium]|nr:CpaF family protein [Candidatus Binatia bacterium]
MRPGDAAARLRNDAVLRPKTVQEFEELKVRIHRELLEKLDLVALASLSREQGESQIRVAIGRLLEHQSTPLSRVDRERVIEEIAYEVLGLGPLDPILQDPAVSDVLINGPDNIYVEKFGKLEKTAVRFRDNAHLMQIIDRIVSRVGRRVDESSPMVDARLPDGSRVNVIIPPLALDGAVMSIRRFGRDPYKIEDLVAFRSMTQEMADVLKAIVHARLNIVVSGGTGSGKTTLLNCLSSFIPINERIVTIEDSAELQLQQPHVVRLETRPPNLEGRGEVTARDLVRNSLRMRPDRIVVGEVRGGESLDMLQAMNTGHDGSLTTLHANSPRECLQRLEMLVLMAGIELPVKAIRQQICSAIDVIVQPRRIQDGTRKVMKITEVIGMEGDTILTQDIFEFVQTGVNASGIVEGYFRATGVRPTFMDRLAAAGVNLDHVKFESRELG